jgi:mycoredoxin
VDNDDLIMYTTGWCGDCRAAKTALEARGIPFVEVDLDAHPGAAARVEALNGGRRSVPTLVRGAAVASLSRFSPAKLDAFLATAGLR